MWYIIRHMLPDGTENSPSEPLFVRNANLPPIRGSAFPKPSSVARNWYHKDHLGTPRLVTDESGNIVSQHDYEPFGVELTRVDPAAANNPNTHRFTGHERDNETGLDYMMARYFMSRDARFTSIDPSPGNLQNPQSQNRYNYTLNNPMKYVDPTGKLGVEFTAQGQYMTTGERGSGSSIKGARLAAGSAAFNQLAGMMKTEFQGQNATGKTATVTVTTGQAEVAPPTKEADKTGEGKWGDVPSQAEGQAMVDKEVEAINDYAENEKLATLPHVRYNPATDKPYNGKTVPDDPTLPGAESTKYIVRYVEVTGSNWEGPDLGKTPLSNLRLVLIHEWMHVMVLAEQTPLPSYDPGYFYNKIYNKP